MLFSITIYSQEPILKYVNGIWNFEADNNEWFIKNATMIGWCPLNNCTGINDSWYSNKMTFSFNIDNESEILVGENLNWDCINFTEPDGLPENDSNGNITYLNCSTNTLALNNSVQLTLLYQLRSFDVRLTYELSIINNGIKNYTNVAYAWIKDVNNLNNTNKNDFLVSKGEYYSLIGDNASDYNKIKQDLSNEGNFYELIFTEANETKNNLIGSQLFGLNYEKNNNTISMDNVKLEIKQKNEKPTKIKFITTFGDLNSSNNLRYSYMAGGDTLWSKISLFQDVDVKPPDNQTSVMMDSILMNATGKIFMVIGSNVCNSSANNYSSFSCAEKFKTPQFINTTVAINSKGRIVVVYTNQTANSNVFSMFTDNFGASFSSPTNISSKMPLSNQFTYSIAADKNDNFHLCIVPSNYINNGEVVYWGNSSDGASWSVANISNIGDPHLGCDIELDSNNNVHMFTVNKTTTVVSTYYYYHYNFTISDDPNATKTIMAIAISSGLLGTVAIDRNNNIYGYAAVSGTVSVNLRFVNSSDNGLTWSVQTIGIKSNDKYPDIVTDNPNSVRAMFLSDDNTQDYSVWYWNTSNSGKTNSSIDEIADSSDITKSLEGLHQLGSSYPVFNKPRGLLHYFYWSDDTAGWYYSNYSYAWNDFGIPDSRFYNDNTTNGTTTTGMTINASLECFDESNISSIIFAVNDGGSTYTNYSQHNFTTTNFYQFDSVNYTVTAGSASIVAWKWYCNDTKGNWHESQNFSILTAPSAGVETTSPMTSGAFVYENNSGGGDNLTMFFFDATGVYKSINVPSKTRIVRFIDFNINPVRNESAIVEYPETTSQEIYLTIFNGSHYTKQFQLDNSAPNTYKDGGSCYRKNGDYVITHANFQNGQPTNKFTYHVWDGVQLLNFTGKGFGTSDVTLAYPYCDINSNNVMIIWAKTVTQGTVQDIKAGILDESNNIINTTEFHPTFGLSRVDARISNTSLLGGVSYTANWLPNGTAYVCYRNNSDSTKPTHHCTQWDNIQKKWTLHIEGKTNANQTVPFYASSVHSSFNNNTFMRAFVNSNGRTWGEYFNSSGFESLNALSVNSPYNYPIEHFKFLNNTNDDGIFVFKDLTSTPYKLEYVNWTGTTNTISGIGIINSETPSQIRTISDKNSPNILIGMVNTSQIYLKIYKFNMTGQPVLFYQVPQRTRSNSEALQMYSMDFYPQSYTVNDTIPPTWSNNLTPSGTFRYNTSTTFSVAWNDNSPQEGYCIFSLNDTGWINDTSREWTPPSTITNTSILKSKRNSLIQWYWTCNDSNGNINTTDIFSKLVVNTPPTLDPYQPLFSNPSIPVGYNMTFNITCSDVDIETTTSYWFVDSVLNISKSPCMNFTVNTSIADVGKTFNINVLVGDNFTNTSLTWQLRVANPPDCDNPGQNYPVNSTSYQYNQTYQWNTTCYIGTGAIDFVKFNFNNSYNVSYDELSTPGGNIFYWNQRNLSASDYQFTWHINLTENLQNNATSWLYQIQKANVTINFSINISSPLTYPTQDISLSCNTSNIGATITLYQNDTAIKSATADISEIAKINYTFANNISAGDWNFSCRSNAIHQNYTDSRNWTLLTIDQFPTSCNLSFIDNPVTLPDKINATNLGCDNPEAGYSYKLNREITAGSLVYEDRTNESNLNVTFGLPGDYAYKVNVTGTRNYSYGEINDILSVLQQNEQPLAFLESPLNESSDGNNSRILDWLCTDSWSGNLNTTIYLSNNLSNLSVSNLTTYFNVNSTITTNQTFNATRVDTRGCNPCYWQVACNDSVFTGTSEIWQFTYTIGKADNVSCVTDEECISGYCDNDGLELADDYLCYTPRNIDRGITGKTYFHDESGTLYCEYDANGDVVDKCDERLNDSGIGTCTNFGENFFEDTCTNNCALNDTYVNSSYLCRSSAFASGCSASPECNGVLNGTNQCTAACVYNPCMIPADGFDWKIFDITCVIRDMTIFFNNTINISKGVFTMVNSILNFSNTVTVPVNINYSSWGTFNMSNSTLVRRYS